MKIKVAYELECQGTWISKIYGVILVQKEEDINALWKLLCEQDNYWERYKELIKVAPTVISSPKELQYMCRYVGRTDIWEIDKIKEKVDFLIYQYSEDFEY